MRFVGDIALDAEVRAIASGAITDGAPVVVNSAGTVSEIAQISSAVGSAVVFESADTRRICGTFDTNSNRIVLFYQDSGNSTYGTVVVGTVDSSDNSISFGTPVVPFSSAIDEADITFDSNSNKVVISFVTNSTGYGDCMVGTVDSSDNSISFGSRASFHSNTTQEIATTFDSSNNKVVIAFKDDADSDKGKAVVATVSGTSISYGSEAIFNDGSSAKHSITFDTSNNKVVVSYRDVGNSGYGTSAVGTVSGTSISFGSEVVYYSGSVTMTASTFDSTNNKVVIAYGQGPTDDAMAIVGTVSGTSISFGTAVEWYNTTTILGGPENINFDSSSGKVVIFAIAPLDGYKGYIYLASVSGTTITFESSVLYSTSGTLADQPSVSFDSNTNRSVFAYHDDGNSSYGTAVVYKSGSTNLTSENFIGFAHAAYADGQKATVKTTGSIARNIPQIASASSTVGTEVVFESATTPHKGIAFDSSNNRIVIGYRDGGNSNYGTAVVGTVSGTSISFGTPVTFDTGGTIDPIAVGFDSNSNKVVIAYRDGGDSDKGKAIVGTVDSSDNSITFGSEAEFNGGNTGYINVVFDSSNNKIVIVYTDYGNSSYGTAIVGTVSGTSISFGSEVVFESAASYYVGASFDSSNNKIVVAYSDDGNSGHGTAIVGTVSGTSISFGTAAVFNAANTTSGFPNNFPVVFDSSNNKIVIAYADEGAGGDGFAIVGTVSGTSISFGTEVEFHNDDIYGVAGVFDPSSNKVVISYGDENNSTHGKFILGTVSGTSISFETAATFASATTTYLVSTIDTNSNRVVIAYHDTGNSNYGTAIVIAPAGQGEDLTIGQQYFVQTDGTLGTSADDPSVIAGTAIGTSDIIVKG